MTRQAGARSDEPAAGPTPGPTPGSAEQSGTRRSVAVALAVAVGVVVVAATAVWRHDRPAPVLAIEASPTTAVAPTTPAVIPQPEPIVTAPPVSRSSTELGPAVGLKLANGQPLRPTIEFRSTIPIPSELVFVLVLGSDARPNEDVFRTRADSIHILAANPSTGQGTVVGIPRDAYVQFPDGRRGKINDSLAIGGPSFAAETVRRLSGLPIHYVVTTGFVGFQQMVDELGGVDVFLDRRMNDKMSGARFSAGWHHFVGGEALAYSRNRTDVPDGDFSRSENHGRLLLAGLSKLRSEVADDPSLLRWLDVVRRNARVEVAAGDLPRLAALARRIAPERVANVVLPGRIGYAGRASVVYLTKDAPLLFDDLRADAVIGAPSAPPPGTAEAGSASSSSTTSAPTTQPPTTRPPTTTTTGGLGEALER